MWGRADWRLSGAPSGVFCQGLVVGPLADAGGEGADGSRGRLGGRIVSALTPGTTKTQEVAKARWRRVASHNVCSDKLIQGRGFDELVEPDSR